jgi:hypothetical protein
MKALLSLGALIATAGAAEAQECRDGGRPKIRIEFPGRVEEIRTERVLVGYRDEIVGYEDVWVEKKVTVYETRTVVKQVYVGRDRCGRPVYETRRVCESVPVCKTVRECQKRPIYQKVPVYETRECRRPEPRWGFSFNFGR